MPMLYSPAPSALNPPTTTAPSSAPMIQATSGPAINIGPMPGMTKKAAPNNIPQAKIDPEVQKCDNECHAKQLPPQGQERPEDAGVTELPHPQPLLYQAGDEG